MNTRQRAAELLGEFMESDEFAVLITGTHQYQKHVLALQMLAMNNSRSTILFRGNHLRNFGTIFEDSSTTYKTGTSYTLNQYSNLYVDTINTTSWKYAPSTVDYGIIYPIDSVCNNNKKTRIIDDIKHRVTRKLFLESWTDNYDYSWLNDIVDRHVVYNVEEEDPEYHQRMINPY